MDARYLATALIPVVPASAGLAKIIMSGDFSDAHINLTNFVDGVKMAAHSTALYSIFVGAILFMSYAVQAGRSPVAQTQGDRLTPAEEFHYGRI